jgi:hypothetical protein
MTHAGLTIVCTTGRSLSAGSYELKFGPSSFQIGLPIVGHRTFISICTSQDVCSLNVDSFEDVIVSKDAWFLVELSAFCGHLMFRSDSNHCSSGNYTSCEFAIPAGHSHAEFSLIFFNDALSSGCFFRLTSLESFLRASSFPVLSAHNEYDDENAFGLLTYPVGLFVSSNPPFSVDTGQLFQTQSRFNFQSH